MKCQVCGKETFLPFQCPYCGDQFCTNHRLPESHNCSKMELVHESKRKNTFKFNKSNSFEYQVNYRTSPQPKKNIYFGYTELKHLAIGSLLVIVLQFWNNWSRNIIYDWISYHLNYLFFHP